MALDTTSYLLGKKSGGGGTADYTALLNKPKINNVELTGNKTNIDLGIKDADVNALPENVYFNEIKPGVYFSNSGSADFYENREATKYCTLSNINYLVIYKTLDSTVVNNETFALCYHFGNSKDGILTTIFYLSNNTLSRSNYSLCYTISTNPNSMLVIPGSIFFKKIPQFNSSSMIPTQDTDIVNKKYVDDRNTYSSSEIVIGKWIDNKPLYRSVFSFTVDNMNTNYTTGISNMDTLVTLRGMTVQPEIHPLPHPASSVYYQQSIVYTKETKTITVKNGTSVELNYDVYVILEYTKTTD